MKRADWHLRANVFIVMYLIAALVSGVANSFSEDKAISWLTVHLLLLGAITNGIVTWSEHFVGALLWSRPVNRVRQLSVLIILNAGIVGVLAGVSMEINWLVVLSAIVIALIISFYLQGVNRFMKESLNKKFIGAIRYYQVAGVSILFGIYFGTNVVFISKDDPLEPRFVLAHLHTNLMGWVGITMIGTLVTLWPTILRTPMHPRALTAASHGLKFLTAGLILVVGAALIDNRALYVLGDFLYLVGVLVALIPSAQLVRKRIPDRASSWMISMGIFGLFILLILDAQIALTKETPEEILEVIEGHALALFTLWLLPIFLGALMYLLPVVLGRGPKVNRELERIINYGWHWRIFLLPASSFFILIRRVPALSYLFAGIALGLFIISVFVTMQSSKRSKRFAETVPPML